MSWPNSSFIARGRNLLIFLFRSVGIQAPRWLWKKMFLDFPSKLLLFKENLTWKYFPIYFYFLKVVISMGLFLTIFCGLFSSVSQTRPPLRKSIIIDDCKFVGNPCVAKMKKCPPPGGGGPLKKRHPDPETDGVPMCHRASIIFSTLWRMENYIPPSKSYLWDHDPSMTIQSIHFLSQQIWTTWHCVNQFLSIY